MILYLVRHGQTDAHAQGRRQSPESSLSVIGRDQAAHIAGELARVQIDYLCSSNWKRAVEAAEIISKVTGKEVLPHPHAHKHGKPAMLNDLPKDHALVQE